MSHLTLKKQVQREKNNLFFVDAECDGLYGNFISVAGIIIDIEGNEIERFYYGIKKENLHVENEWVKENVLPKLGDYIEYPDEKEMLEAFWKKWLQYQKDAYAIGDVIYPVECRLFQRCVEINEEKRRLFAPYPLLDLASILYDRKMDPLCERTKLSGCIQNAVQHNALFDIEMTVKIWNQFRITK